jgi:2-methylcitrate dehydratase PrpD
MTDCYIKPNPCCRHIQPATEALIALMKDEGIATEEVKHIAVETYRIAAEHAATGWDDFASSQLSFRYLVALALKFRAIRFPYFEESVRRDPSIAALAGLIQVSAPTEIDRLYPRLRPARVTVTTARGKFTRQVEEALGSRLVPFDDDGLKGKFLELVSPVHGEAVAKRLAEQVWTIEDSADVRPLIEALAKT